MTEHKQNQAKQQMERHDEGLDHPLHAVHDVREEVWRGRHNTRVVIFITCIVVVVTSVLFILIEPIWNAPVIAPADPVATGAQRAFDVVPPSPPQAVPSRLR